MRYMIIIHHESFPFESIWYFFGSYIRFHSWNMNEYDMIIMYHPSYPSWIHAFTLVMAIIIVQMVIKNHWYLLYFMFWPGAFQGHAVKKVGGTLCSPYSHQSVLVFERAIFSNHAQIDLNNVLTWFEMISGMVGHRKIIPTPSKIVSLALVQDQVLLAMSKK